MTTEAVINTSLLTPRPEYLAAKAKAESQGPEYRPRYNALLDKAIKVIRGFGFTKAQAERLANNYTRQFIEPKFIYNGQRMNPGCYDLDNMESDIRDRLPTHDPDQFSKEYWRA